MGGLGYGSCVVSFRDESFGISVLRVGSFMVCDGLFGFVSWMGIY